MMFEKIHDMENLKAAWERVRASKSPPGIDRIGIADYRKNLDANLHALRRQLESESYKPLPTVVFNKHKRQGKGERVIGISTIRDKVVQQAVLRVIGPRFENHFLPCSHAYRPGKSALSAVQKAADLIRKGRLWALQMDVARFFDTMDHGILTELIGRVIDEKPLVRLISRLLKAKIFREMGLFDTVAGSQQGSGLSPLLSNIYLHPVDCLLWKRHGEAYLRYSDDITVLATEKAPLEAARSLIEKCLAEVKLSANAEKTTIVHAAEGIVYLGYHLDANGKGPARKSVQQLRERLSAFDKVRRTDDMTEKLGEATAVIRGWHGYYRTLKPLDPPNIVSLLAQAELAREFGETALARSLLKQSADFTHTHPDIHRRAGELFLSLGMERQAMREFARTLELDPDRESVKAQVRRLQEKEDDIHKAIEKVRLVLHHNPAYQEGYRKLAECYTRLGLYGFAEKAHEKALEIDAESVAEPRPGPAAEPEANQGFDHRTVDLELFLRLFSGRSGVHAKQWVDEKGRWGFMRVDRPLKKKDARAHLAGETTLAVHPVLDDDTVRFIVFDVDTAKRKILESGPEALDAFRKRAHEDVQRLKAACRSAGLSLHVEDSGYKGRHGWLLFDGPVAAEDALTLGRTLMKAAGGPSEDMIWELFPMGKSERHKSVIKLPLGVNRKNKRRCLFLTDGGEPIADQSLFLRSLKINAASLAAELTADQRPAPADDPMADAPPAIRKMIENCAILGHLVAKARDTHYLTHYERICLLYTVTFAGKEGVAFLHKVIGYCVNYNRDYTQRRVETRKESPMSCPKIAEYFPELVETLSCKCKFDLPARGYPSPVMYLLESELEQADPAAAARAGAEPASEAPEPRGAGEPGGDPPRRDAPDEAPVEAPDEAPDEAPKPAAVGVLDFESLFRDEYAGGAACDAPPEIEDDPPETIPETPEADAPEAAACAPPPEPSEAADTAPAPEPRPPRPKQTADETESVWCDAAEMLQQIQRRRAADRRVRKIQERLGRFMDDLRTDAVETPFGAVARRRGPDGRVRWSVSTDGRDADE